MEAADRRPRRRPELGRPEMVGREARPDAVELFVVIARAEGPLRRSELRGRLRERAIEMDQERIEAGLLELVRRRMVKYNGRTVLPRQAWTCDEEKGWWD